MSDDATSDDTLKLMALDADDLAVLSANLQDATLRVRDMAYLPGRRRFALVVARYDWVAARAGAPQRVGAGLHFERVFKAQVSGFDPRAGDTSLSLLTIAFEPGAAPSGTVVLTFSGGAAVRLEVEVIEAQVRDVGPREPAPPQPGHPDTDPA